MSKGVKIALIIVGALLATCLIAGGAGYFVLKTTGPKWQADLRENGRKVQAEGAAAGASATKDECVQLAIKRLGPKPGFMDQVTTTVFLESCLEVATGTLKYCEGVPPASEIMATVAWRFKTSAALGLADGDNPIVKGIQAHCTNKQDP